MQQECSTYHEDLQLLNDCLGLGIEQQWSHELRKQILKLLHQLKSISRKMANSEIEYELLAVEKTLGFGSGKSIVPEVEQIEDHQLRLMELVENMILNKASAGSSVAIDENDPESSIKEKELLVKIKDDIKDEREDDAGEIAEKAEGLEQAKIQLILCNCPGRDAARDLAHGLVKSRLAARVNVIANIGAIYWLDDEINDTAECQLQIKTATDCLEDVIYYIKQNHPDELPEIIAIAIDEGNAEYFDWVKQQTGDKSDD